MALSDERWLAAIRRGEKTQHRVLADSALPPVTVGERFWLRESYCRNDKGGIDYLADQDTPFVFDKTDGDWKERSWLPPAVMPRAFSRLTIEIVDVRMERLQDAPKNGGIAAEGLPATRYNAATFLPIALSMDRRTRWFIKEWDAEQPPEGKWENNPIVWVIEWLAIEQNIDADREEEGESRPSYKDSVSEASRGRSISE